MKKKSILMSKFLKKEVPVNSIVKKEHYLKNKNIAVAFIGLKGKGKTTIIELLANQLSKSKINVSILDLTQNRDLWKINCWDDEDCSEDEMAYKLNSHCTLYSSKTIFEGDVLSKIGGLKANCNILLIDCDSSTASQTFAICDTIFIVHDMNIKDIIDLKELALDISELATSNKITLILNKFIDSGADEEIILKLLTNPIKQFKFVNNKVNISNNLFRITYDNLIYVSDFERFQARSNKIKKSLNTDNDIEILSSFLLQ